MKSDLEMEIDLREQYDQMLNESYPEVKIGYSTFTASEILACCDPVMYKEGFSDYLDSINTW
jgi:hypothetical protein